MSERTGDTARWNFNMFFWQYEIEQHATRALEMCNQPVTEAPSLVAMSVELTGFAPAYANLVGMDGWFGSFRGHYRIFLVRGLTTERERFVLGHELGHAYFRTIGYGGDDIEECCDAFSAAICAPWLPFATAIHEVGHRVHVLAEAFHIEQAQAMLRIGEVTGRPVALVRPKPIVRGGQFDWPKTGSGLHRAVSEPPAGVHPVRVDRRRWGLMAG